MCKAVLLINRMENRLLPQSMALRQEVDAIWLFPATSGWRVKRPRFSQIFTKRGVHPDWGGVYFLPRLVGYSKAAELIFSAEIIDAAEAFRIGLVNKVYPHEEFETSVKQFALRIAKNAPIPIAFAKRGFKFQQWDLAQALDYESYVLEVCMKSNDICRRISVPFWRKGSLISRAIDIY